MMTMDIDEWRKRQNAVVPPRLSYTRWYPSTLRAVLADVKRTGES
jgi:hypothetical protein